MLSPDQWYMVYSNVSLCLHGTYLSYMTNCHSESVLLAGQLSMQWTGYHGQCKQAVVLKCIIQFRYVMEAFNLYGDIARCLSPTPI